MIYNTIQNIKILTPVMIMPELDRASTYSPEEMDCEYVPWDCDNVSGEGEVSDDEEVG